MIKYPRLFALAWAGLLCLSAPTAYALDLLEAVRAATQIDPLLASARAQHTAQQERIPQARAGLLPSVNGSANALYNNLETSQSTARDWSTQSLGLSATVPLYRPANRVALEQSELNAELAYVQLAQVQQDVVVRVAQAYFDVLAAQDSLTVVRAQKQAISEQYAAARRNFEVGTATVTDQQEAQSRLDLTRAQEVGIENDLAVKRALLAQLIGQPVAPLHTLRPNIDVDPPEAQRESQWAQTARENNWAVKQATLYTELAQRDIAKQRAGHQPTLDLITQGTFGRGTSGAASATLADVRTTSGVIGLQATLPVYQGGAITARVREAIALQDKSQADLEAARRNAEQTARQTFLGVKSGLEQVRALTAAERSSQLALESNQLGYQVGVRINIDVLNAAQQVFSTQRDLARARYDVLLNGLRLRNTAGVLEEADIVRVNGLLEAPKPNPPATSDSAH